MSAPPGPDPQQQQQQAGAPTTGTGAPAPAPPPQAPVQTPAQGLPPTGIDQQLETINQTNQVANAVAQPADGANPQVAGMQMAGAPAPTAPVTPAGATGGSTDIQQLARSLAQQYGLPIGRGDIVDAQGNFLQTPDQVGGSGGHGADMANAAAKMNFISSAIANEQNRQQQQKGIAAIQTGLGQVQSRGRGSLAAMQSGLYQDLADLYSNQEYEAADFSFFIQQGMFQQAQHAAHRARKSSRRTARYQMIGAAVGAAGGLLA